MVYIQSSHLRPQELIGKRPCMKGAPQSTAPQDQDSVGIQSKLLHVRSFLKETMLAGE